MTALRQLCLVLLEGIRVFKSMINQLALGDIIRKQRDFFRTGETRNVSLWHRNSGDQGD